MEDFFLSFFLPGFRSLGIFRDLTIELLRSSTLCAVLSRGLSILIFRLDFD